MTIKNNNPMPLLTPREAARELRTTVGNLTQLRYQGRGPSYLKLGKEVRYDRREIDRYLRAKDDRTMLTLDDLATWWGVSVEKIHSLRSGDNALPTHKHGRRVMVNRGQAQEFMQSLIRTPGR